MAQRRMFSLKVVDTDLFLEMPQSSQLLYFHLAMRADDDGFISSPKKIMRFAGAKDDDFRVLITKEFILPFKSGVIVIRHWKENNQIRKDRKNETIYQEELANLSEDTNGVYQMTTNCQPMVGKMATQVRLGKGRLGKNIGLNKNSTRNNISYKKEDYNTIIDKYQQLKEVTLVGDEFLPIQQSIKTMFRSGRKPKEIIDCMKFFASSNEEIWQQWTINTVKIKLPEFLSGKLKG